MSIAEHRAVERKLIDQCYINSLVKMRNLTPLDKLLIKKGFIEQMLMYFKGKFYKGVVCYDPITNKEEYHDYNDVVGKIDDSMRDTVINIINSNVEKTTIFKYMIKGTFYKWETTSGLYFILSHTEVATLSMKEKRLLRMF
jgi:hypothetical protein